MSRFVVEIVRQEILRSDVKVEGLNWKELGRYVRMTCPPAKWRKWGIRRLLPRRKKSGNKEPSIIGPEAQAKLKESDQWLFPEVEPTQAELKALLAAAVGRGVMEVFKSHT